MQCRRYKRYGHFEVNCRVNLSKKNGERSNFAEKDDETEISLLMACHHQEEIDH